MKKIFSVLLSLALVLSLGMLTAAPVLAVEQPTISPEAADFDLCDPVHIAITLDLGDADDLASIEDAGGPLTPDSDYYQFDNLVVITAGYLSGELTCAGEELLLQFNFEKDASPYGVAFLTVTAIGVVPVLQSNAEDFNLWEQDDVTVGVDLGCCPDIFAVLDEADLALEEDTDWEQDSDPDTLTILESYLNGELTALGDDIELTIVFACCYDEGIGAQNYTDTLTITTVGATKPSIAPTTAAYDLCIEPGGDNSMEFDITWDGADNIVKIENITDAQHPVEMTGGSYCLEGYPADPASYVVAGDTLTICDFYLDYLFVTAGLSSSLLRVTFDDDDDTEVLLWITAEWSEQPTLGLTGTDYTWDIVTQMSAYGPMVLTLVDFGCATNITRIYDDQGYNLTSTGMGKCGYMGDYIVSYDPGYGFLIVTYNCYTANELTYLGDRVDLTVEFDKGADCTYSITATGDEPSVSPSSGEFNLDSPNNVTTTVDWGCCAGAIDGIDGLVVDEDYTLVGDELTIVSDYLSGVLTEIGDTVALTIDFDEGENVIFTISAVGTPLCFIATAAGADAPQLDTLREFRDEVLRPNTPWLVSLYYEISPSIAKVIAGNEALKLLVKECVVDPATWIAEMLLD